MPQNTTITKKNTAVPVLIAVAVAIAGVCISFYWGRRAPEPQAPAPSDIQAPFVQEPAAEPAPIDAVQVQMNRAEGFLIDSLKSYRRLHGYQAMFDKETLNDDGTWEKARTFIRFNKPFTILMAWLDGEKKGLQLLYSAKHFNGKMIVRLPGLLFSLVPPVEVAPDDPRVTKMEKHPITSAGLGYFLDEFTQSFREGKKSGAMKILAIESVDVKGERGTLVDHDFNGPGFDYARTAIVYSEKTGLPLEVRLYEPSDKLVETYRYLDLAKDPPPDDPVFVQSVDGRVYKKYLSIFEKS